MIRDYILAILFIAKYFFNIGESYLINKLVKAETFGDIAVMLQSTAFLSQLALFGRQWVTLAYLPIYQASKQLGKIIGLMKFNIGAVAASSLVTGTVFFIFYVLSNQPSIGYLPTYHLVIFVALMVPISSISTLLATTLVAMGFPILSNSLERVARPTVSLLIYIFFVYVGKGFEPVYTVMIWSGTTIALICIIVFCIWSLVYRHIYHATAEYESSLWLGKGIAPMIYELCRHGVVVGSLVLEEVLHHDEVLVSVYAVSIGLAEIIFVVFRGVVINLALPSIAAVFPKYKDTQERLNRLFLFLLFQAVIIFLVFAVYGATILSWFNAKYVAGYNALMILVIGYIAHLILGVSAHILKLGHKLRIVNIAHLAMVFLSLALGVMLIPTYGIDGAAFSVAFPLIATYLYLAVDTQKVLGFSCYAITLKRG